MGGHVFTIFTWIIGVALIVLSWTLFPYLSWHIAASIVCTVVGALILVFALLFTVYFYNLDMKMTSKLEKPLNKHYDKIKRNRKI